ncbi:hypothetical protein JCM5296_005453 [Sporobolomyces johnsonii]
MMHLLNSLVPLLAASTLAQAVSSDSLVWHKVETSTTAPASTTSLSWSKVVTTTSTPQPTSTTSLSWVKVTTSRSSSTSSSTSSSPVVSAATSLISAKGYLNSYINLTPPGPIPDPMLLPLIYYDSPVCPESTYTNKLVVSTPGQYNKHGGLRRFCGKQVQLLDPKNSALLALPADQVPSSMTFVITRGCTSEHCPGTSVGVTVLELGAASWSSEHAIYAPDAAETGWDVKLRFLD